MKLTALLILIACMHVSASSYSQTVTFSGKNVPLTTVFASIEKQTGLSFFFNYALIKDIKPVSLDVHDVPLEDALHEVLKGQGLEFYRTGKTIFVVKKGTLVSAPADKNETQEARQVDVSGKVTNQQGEPLAGASVETKNGKRATLTDEKGIFKLKKVPTGTTLIISYLGYQRKEIVVDEGNPLAVVLQLSNSQLDQAQVIAYGSTTERLNTGNVTTVTAEDIEKQPVSNPLLALEGRVPGLVVTQSTGLPGSGILVQIRGQNSIGSGNDPFYVIDGVPYTSELLPNLGFMLGASGVNPAVNTNGSPFNFIDPSEIESISVLKDAAATAIYGSRAANGAILITTKKGKAGKTAVDINLQNGFGQVGTKMPLLNTQQYLQMRHEAIANDGLQVQATDYDINGSWDTTRQTDWQKTLIGRTSQYTNMNANVSGGSVNAKYLIGGTYHKETTVFPGDFSDEKAALHFNISTNSVNQKFKMQLSGSYLIDNNQLPQNDLTGSALLVPPDAPPLYNKDGSLNWMQNASGSSTWYNPLAYLYDRYQNKTNNLISNADLAYLILPGLEIRSSFGYTNLQSDEIQTVPLISYPPETRPLSQRVAMYGNNNINSWIVEPQVTFKKNIAEGKLDLLVGSTINQINSNGYQLYGIGYNSDQVLDDIRSASSITVQSSIASVYKYNALFGRLNYILQDRYILDLSLRKDGSSRFGLANQFHDFGAASAAWIFSQEDFFKKDFSFLSFGKIRASYGTTGNDQIGDYQFLDLYLPTTVSVPYQGANGLLPNNLPNYYLQWEETKKFEVGIDLGLYKERILFNSSYFRNRSSNQLLSYSLPIITGFTGITRNFPATVQNSGWEFTLNTSNIKKRHFNWTSKINLTLPQNKLIAFPNLATSSYASRLYIGKPITIQRVYHYRGVDPATGLYQFADGKGGLTSSPDIDYQTTATTIINTSPTLTGGFENNFTYKQFSLDFLFQFVRIKGINYYFGEYPGAIYHNQPVYVLDRWQKPDDIATHQKYNSNYSLFEQLNDAQYSDAGFSNASYIRLKNLSLSWQMPEKWRAKAHLQNVRIYLQGQNLLTITRYHGLDPENLNASSLPPLRVVTGGIQITL